VVFYPAVVANDVYFVTQGRLRYSQDTDTSAVAEDVTQQVQERVWICEAALWSNWAHVGTLKSVLGCTLMMVNATNLLHVFRDFLRSIL
jgi:hypothetical protein